MKARGLADGAGAVHDGVLPGPSGNERSRLHRGPPACRRSAHTRAGRPSSPRSGEPTAVREIGTLSCPAGLPAGRHAHPPIRTLTVGAGVPPAQPLVPGCLTLPWHERVADCYRRFGLSPTPEHVAAGKDTTQSSHDDTWSFSLAVRALTGRHSECVEPVTTSRTVTHGVRNRPAQMIRALPERGLQCL